MADHTPSPWLVHKGGRYGDDEAWFVHIPSQDDLPLAFDFTDEGEANARLVAQSPDMYDMLKQCKGTFEFLSKRAENEAVELGHAVVARNIGVLLDKADGINPVPSEGS